MKQIVSDQERSYRAEAEVQQYAKSLFLDRELFATRKRRGILRTTCREAAENELPNEIIEEEGL